MFESCCGISHALRAALTLRIDHDGSCNVQDLGVKKSNAEILFNDNFPKLQQIKKKYDPKNIFVNWFPITPAP